MRKIFVWCLAVAAVLWVPFVVMYLEPGWGSLILLPPYGLRTPYFILLLLPLLVPLFNGFHPGKSLPRYDTVLQSAFFALWFCIGLFFVNGGDTQESVGSLFSDYLGGHSATAISLSGSLMAGAMWGSLLVLIAVMYRAILARAKQMLLKTSGSQTLTAEQTNLSYWQASSNTLYISIFALVGWPLVLQGIYQLVAGLSVTNSGYPMLASSLAGWVQVFGAGSLFTLVLASLGIIALVSLVLIRKKGEKIPVLAWAALLVCVVYVWVFGAVTLASRSY